MVHRFLDKIRTRLGAGASTIEEPAQTLHKPVIKKFGRRNVYASFKDNIWAADLAEMGSLFPFNHGIKYSTCVTDVFTKYALVKTLKDKKGKIVLHGFIEIVNESKRKPNKLWVDQGR